MITGQSNCLDVSSQVCSRFQVVENKNDVWMAVYKIFKYSLTVLTNTESCMKCFAKLVWYGEWEITFCSLVVCFVRMVTTQNIKHVWTEASPHLGKALELMEVFNCSTCVQKPKMERKCNVFRDSCLHMDRALKNKATPEQYWSLNWIRI